MAAPSAPQLLAEIRQASQHSRNGRRADALILYQDVNARAGALAAVQFELGNLCREIGDAGKAVTHYAIAVEAAPDDARYVRALGLAYLASGEDEKARETLERALDLEPGDAAVQHGLGVYHMQHGDDEKAIAYLERACELKPSDAGIRANLTVTLNRLDRHDEALAHARKAVRIDASSPGNHLVLAETLAALGNVDEALEHLEQTIRRHKSFGLAYELLARLRKFSKQDAPFIRKTETVLGRGMPSRDRIGLHFALGKMHDDCGSYDEAFAHYAQGNLLDKRDYDLKRDERLLRDLKKVFTARALEALRPLGHTSAKPVFIVGMPRSGTTLMERIIASHPRAAAAGELPEITRIAEQLLGRDPRSGTRAKLGLTQVEIDAFAERYLRVLTRGRPDAERIVDKMPANFFFVGLIKTLFPNAAVIHAVRHPLDTCLSCHFQWFTSLHWTRDLASTAKFYSLYRKTMEHWSQVLPDGAIVELRYEALVEDPETQARRMLEACGLEWDPSVLEFFRAPSAIRTASVAQARQPIYKTSRMRWIHYAEHLEPLLAELAPYLESDRAMLRDHGIDLPAASGWLKQLLR